jgi:hypothetical protein
LETDFGALTLRGVWALADRGPIRFRAGDRLGQRVLERSDLTYEARHFLLGLPQLSVRRRATHLKCFSRITMAPLSRFEAPLPLFSFMPRAIDLLVRPIFAGSKVRRGALSFLLHGGEAGSAFRLEGFELARLPIGQGLQPISLLGQIFPKAVAIAELAVQSGAGVLGQLLSRFGLGDRSFSLS